MPVCAERLGDDSTAMQSGRDVLLKIQTNVSRPYSTVHG